MPRNSEQFRREGKFGTGQADGSEVAVYAIKAHQLRVYGGFKRIRGEDVFFCVEAAKKKRNKADQAQLKRVAEKLGEINGGP